jgi:centrosomal protein CEP76
MEIWQQLHTFLVSKKGDIQDHCVLLCNLLIGIKLIILGFHLDAYVTMGTDSNNRSHIWVTTIESTCISKLILAQATFWETLNGLQYLQTEKHHFRTIGCCFNSKFLYANIQVKDSASSTNFKLQDATQWKKLSSEKHISPVFTLQPLRLDTAKLEFELESELHQLIEFYRKDRHLFCVWDESLSHLLGQCLWSLEHEKLYATNPKVFTNDFQIGVKRSIPEGHIFKGYPICFNHYNTQKIFSEMSRIKQCCDIFNTRGDCVRMAVRVKIFPYTDKILACWVLIGSRSLP